MQFPLIGEPLAVDLANTVIRAAGRERDLLTEPGGVGAWLDAVSPRLPGRRPAAHALVELREAIRELFAAAEGCRRPAAAAVALVNARACEASPAVAAAPGGPRARWHGGAPALAAIAQSAVAVLRGEPGDLRACAGPDCVLRFASGDARRRFCSAAGCANRTRQARHRARRRDRAK